MTDREATITKECGCIYNLYTKIAIQKCGQHKPGSEMELDNYAGYPSPGPDNFTFATAKSSGIYHQDYPEMKIAQNGRAVATIYPTGEWSIVPDITEADMVKVFHILLEFAAKQYAKVRKIDELLKS